MENKRLILAYGSLRKGDYNYTRFKEYFKDEFQYVKTLELPGFDLYYLPYGYPGVKRNPHGKITVDIIEVTEGCYAEIEAMETYADYTPLTFETLLSLDDNGENLKYYEATLFLYNGGVTNNNFVKHGDWIKFINEQNKS